MFGFDKLEEGSQKRFYDRLLVFREKAIPAAIHHYWWVVHNCIAHPLIGVAPVKWTFDFHDYTSKKINAE